MLRLIVILFFLVGIVLLFSYLATFLVKKFGKLIAISSILSLGLIISAVLIAHEDGCVIENEINQALKVCWLK